jgi:hypothetical protein
MRWVARVTHAAVVEDMRLDLARGADEIQLDLFLDTGHFALETHVGEIAGAIGSGRPRGPLGALVSW